MREYNPDWVSPPYDTVFDCYVDQGKTETEANNAIKRLLGFTDKDLARFSMGNLHLTDVMIQKLAEEFSAPQQFWKNREAQYRVQRLRIEKVKDRIERIEAQLKGGRRSRAIDLVFDTDQWMKSQDYLTVELFIRKMTEKVDKFPSSVPGSLIAVTLPWAQEEQIQESRWDLYDALYNHMAETKGSKYAYTTLANLRS